MENVCSNSNVPGYLNGQFTLNPDVKEFIPLATSLISGNESREESECSYHSCQSNGTEQPALYKDDIKCEFSSSETNRNEQAVAKTEICADLITLSKPFNASENNAFEVRDADTVDILDAKMSTASLTKRADEADVISQSAPSTKIELFNDPLIDRIMRYMDPDNYQMDHAWCSENHPFCPDACRTNLNPKPDQCTQNLIEIISYLLQDNEPSHAIQQELRDLLNCAALTENEISTSRVVPAATVAKHTSLIMMCTRSDEELLYTSAWNVPSPINSTDYPKNPTSMGPVCAENLNFLFSSTPYLHDAPAVRPASWASLFKSTPYQHGTPTVRPVRAALNRKESSAKQLTKQPTFNLTVGSYSGRCTKLVRHTQLGKN